MQKSLNTIENIISVLPQRLRLTILNATRDIENKVQEIVIRTHRPVCIYINGEQFYLTSRGTVTREYSDTGIVKTNASELADSFNSLCGYSVYSHINEIKEGFITIKGGHRAAISGTAVVSNGDILNIRDISSISLRVSREIIGCGKSVAQELTNTQRGLLICGAPISGKTTVLRDLARVLSCEYNFRVSIIDSRGELGAVSRGVPQNDIGACDVLDGYPRSEGIMQAVRCLSPQYIICDEIGSKEDVKAILSGVNSGVKFVASIHAGDKDELLSKANIRDILGTGAFSKIVFLKGRNAPGVIENIVETGELTDV